MGTPQLGVGQDAQWGDASFDELERIAAGPVGRWVIIGQVDRKGLHGLVVVALAGDAGAGAKCLVTGQHPVGHLEETVHPVAVRADHVHRQAEALTQVLQVALEQRVDLGHGRLDCRGRAQPVLLGVFGQFLEVVADVHAGASQVLHHCFVQRALPEVVTGAAAQLGLDPVPVQRQSGVGVDVVAHDQDLRLVIHLAGAQHGQPLRIVDDLVARVPGVLQQPPIFVETRRLQDFLVQAPAQPLEAAAGPWRQVRHGNLAGRGGRGGSSAHGAVDSVMGRRFIA